MRKITEIIIHCSATIEGKNFTARDIDRWHRQRGFQMIGYNYIIRIDGTIEIGRPLEMVGAHCVGHNRNSIGICYIGGLSKEGSPKDTRTPQQRKSMTLLIRQLQEKFPNVTVHGHNGFANKICPCFRIDDLQYLAL